MKKQALHKSNLTKFTTQIEAKSTMISKMGMKTKLDDKKWVKQEENQILTKKWGFKPEIE